MTCVIIIGFEYQIDKIPSAIIDIYHAYHYFNNLGYKIHIASDIKRAFLPNNVEDLILKEVIPRDFVHFTETGFIKIRKLVDTKITFISFLRKAIIEKTNRLIVYYTGHSVSDSIIFPNKEHIFFIELRKILTNMMYNSMSRLGSILDRAVDIPDQPIRELPEPEILMIFDCCNPHGLDLPYKLDVDKKRFRLIEDHDLKTIKPGSILVIMSSSNDEKSVARHNGSLFTRYFFQMLRDEKSKYDLPGIAESLTNQIETEKSGYKQTVTIYSSYNFVPVMWMWVIRSDIHIHIDENIQSIVVELPGKNG